LIAIYRAALYLTAEGGSLSSHQQPKIIHLNIFDTDFAKMAAGEAIPEEKKRRLGFEQDDFQKLGKQVAQYRYGNGDQQRRDDILCSIATTAGLFSMADMEDITDRQRFTGRFFLTEGERQQVINWLMDELGVNLNAPPPEWAG
jgi:hypothetical protein